MLCLIQVTFPNEQSAAEITNTLLDEHLVACGSIFPKIRSIYTWQNQREDTEEALVLYKTTDTLYEKIQNRIKNLHPYETPEILLLPITTAHPAYTHWVENTVTHPK